MSDQDLSNLETATRSTPAQRPRKTPTGLGQTLKTGDRVGRYVISRSIAGGGMGEVYLARDESLDRAVALKVIRRDALSDKRIEAFLREARTTAQFSHPNIVVIHEVGTWQGEPFLALEYLDGPTLRQWLSDQAPTLEEALRVTLDITEALVEAHERGFAHRDLKPANIIIANDGRARVLDFGLAAALDEHEPPGGGTRKYMAPEQGRREAPTPAVDIWSLGLIVRKLLRRHREALRIARLHEETDSSEDSSIGGALEVLLRAAAEEDPGRRPSAAVFRDEVLRLLEQARVEADLARTRHMLGRELERGRLLEEAVALRDGGRGGILGVEGDAGLGKTLLLLDFFRRAEAAGLEVLHGSADAVLRHTPFHAWRSVLLQLVTGRSDQLPGEPLPASARESLGAYTSVLDNVLQTSEAATWTLPLLELESRAEVTTRALTQLFAESLRRPTVVVIDDWHWADSASCRLARSLVLAIPQLLIVVCYRPIDESSEEHVALSELPRFRSIRLPPLTDRSVGRIVESRFPSAEPGGELSRLVIRHAAGNPLFAEELTALAQQSTPGLLVGETTLTGVLNRRLDALPEGVREVLTTASVVGRRFRSELLERIHGEEVVAPALARLLEVGLIRKEQGRYSFWHDVTCSATYGRLEGKERRERHRQVAGALEAMGGEAARQHNALADHWFEAGEVEKTVEHAEIAAEQALGAGAYQEAIRLLQRCLKLKPFKSSRRSPPERPMRWRRLLAETHYALGQLAEANAEAHRVLALAGRDFPTSWLSRRTATGWRFAQALLLTGRRPAAGSEAGPTLDIARALGIAATAAWYFNDAARMHYAALAAFCEAHRSGFSQTLVLSASRLGCEIGMRGWPRVGGRFARVAETTASELDDDPATAYVLLMDALYRIGVADWARVTEALDRCQIICDEQHDDANWCNAQAIRYWSYHYRRLKAEARQAAQDLFDRADTTGNEQHRGWGGRCQAIQMLYDGDAEGARRNLEDSLDSLRSAGDRIELIPARGALGLAWARLGDRDRAITEADEALKLVHPSGSLSSHAMLEGCSGIVEVYLIAQAEGWEQKTAAGWERAVSQSLRVLKRYRARFPVGEARYALWSGVAAQNAGHGSRARRCWQRGLAVAADLGLEWDTERISSRLHKSA